MDPRDSNALENEAHTAWDRGQHKVAFRIFSSLAQKGVKSTWLNLGYLYDCGIGVGRNRSLAMLWYKRAYRARQSAAASNIATIYRDEGKHRLEAEWYRRAVKLKDGDAAVELAKLYLSGRGVRRNARTAAAYLRRAIASPAITEAGLEVAQSLIGGSVGRPNKSLERTRER